jgi:hypothetical protein
MSTTQILASAGTSAEELDTTVRTFRSLTSPQPELVPADTFDAERSAAIIEDLASRLAAVNGIVEPILMQGGAVADLAKSIAETVLPSRGTAKEIAAEALSADGPDSTPLFTENLIYGHPGLRHLVHGNLDHDRQMFTFDHYVVDTAGALVHPMRSGESPAAAAARITGALPTAA